MKKNLLSAFVFLLGTPSAFAAEGGIFGGALEGILGGGPVPGQQGPTQITAVSGATARLQAWLLSMITSVSYWIFGLIATLCVFMIIFGGYQYLFGAIEGKGEGKQTIMYAVTGLVIALLAYVIVATVMGVIGGSPATS